MTSNEHGGNTAITSDSLTGLTRESVIRDAAGGEGDCVSEYGAAGSVREHRVTLSFGRNNQDSHPRPQVLSLAELEDRFSAPDTERGRLTSADYHALDKKDPSQKALRDAEKNGEYFIAAEFHGDGRRRHPIPGSSGCAARRPRRESRS